ncbi:MAG: hypothetical protein Q8P02_00420 [Candidatus Micrarchaeota archaeon]|nr:hypothetical protein [Candidatus Micrarchaeota archaeon]
MSGIKVFDMKRLLLLLFAVLLLGCAAPLQAPIASPAAAPSATILPTPTSTPTPKPSATPEPLASPSPTPAPSLSSLAAAVGPLAQGYFNDSQAIREVSAGVWVVGNDFAFYRYTVSVQDAKRHWVDGDALASIAGLNRTLKAQVITDTRDRIFSGVRAPGTFYGYAALMKCFGQKYDVQLVVQDYMEIRPEYYRDTVGPAFAKLLADECPA